MKSESLRTIEKELPRLSQQEQIWLLELVANHLRKSQRRESLQAELEAMANDPQIQAEIRQIEAEFSVAEGDGLETI